MDKLGFTFWVTEECNLRCNYCYVSKQPIMMDKLIADKAIAFAKDQIEQRENSEIIVSFHGGEPTMNFGIINYLTEYFVEQYGKRVSFQLTTNGVAQQKSMYDYFMKNSYMISVSLDGTKECNDINRITRHGNSSYDDVMSTLSYFHKYRYDIRIRMTINALNVHLFSKSFIFLFNKQLGSIAFAVDTFNSYDENFWDIFLLELEKIMEYLYRNAFEWYKYYKKAISQEYLSIKKICVGGKNTFHIDGNGSIYPCMFAVGYGELSIGNVDQGINEQKLNEISCISEMRNPKCEKCAARQICKGEYCKIINKRYSGDFLLPSINNCKIIRVYHELILKSEKGWD